MTNTQSNRRLPATASGYELREQIGQGTCAAVYRAWCEQVQDEVAIKVVDLEWLQAPLEDIGREIQVMSLSSHSNVLPFSTAFVQGADLWVVMPLLTGGSVLSLMNCAHPDGLPENYAAYVLHCLLKALDYFHSNGQIHRDVKAANLMLDSHGNVMLSDYGMMGWMVEGGWDRKQRQTFVGTPCWMAPEVMEQASGYDYKADVWSLGITAIELAEGRAPYTNYPPMKVLFLTLQNPPPTLTTEHSEQFSQKYKDFVLQCLQKDPKERPTVKQLLKHPLFVPAVPKPEDLPSTIAKLPPIGSRGGSQKQLIRQLQKVSAPGSSGIHDRTAKGFGWDFGDGTPAQTSVDSDTSMHSQSSQDQQSENTSSSAPSDIMKRHASAPITPRMDDVNSSFGTPATDTRINSSSPSESEFGQKNDPAMWSTNSLPTMHRSTSTLSSASVLSAPLASPNANNVDHRRNFSTTSPVTSSTVPAKTVGLLKKGRFTVSDVVNPDKLGGKIDSFLDDDSNFFPSAPSSTIPNREGAPPAFHSTQSSITQPTKPPVHPASQNSLHPRVQSSTQLYPQHHLQPSSPHFNQSSQGSSNNITQTTNHQTIPPITSLSVESSARASSQNPTSYSSHVLQPSGQAATSFPLQLSTTMAMHTSSVPNVHSSSSPELVGSAMKPVVVSNPQPVSYPATRQLSQPEIQIVNPSSQIESQRYAQQPLQPMVSVGPQIGSQNLHYSLQHTSQPVSHPGAPAMRQPTEQQPPQYTTTSMPSPASHQSSRQLFQSAAVPITRVPSQNGLQTVNHGQVDDKNHATLDDLTSTSEKNVKPSQSNTPINQSNSESVSGRDTSLTPFKSVSLPTQPTIVTVGEIPKVSSVERPTSRDPLADKAPEIMSPVIPVTGMSPEGKQLHSNSGDPNDQARSRTSNNLPGQADVHVQQKPNAGGGLSSLVGSKESQSLNRPGTSVGQIGATTERDISVLDGRTRSSNNVPPVVSMKGTSNPFIVTVDPELANRVVQGVVAAVTNTSNHHVARTDSNVFVQSDGSNTYISNSQIFSATSTALSISDLPVGHPNHASGARAIPQIVSVGPDHSQRSKQLQALPAGSTLTVKAAEDGRTDDDKLRTDSISVSRHSSRLIDSEIDIQLGQASTSDSGKPVTPSMRTAFQSGYPVNKQQVNPNDNEVDHPSLVPDKHAMTRSDGPVHESRSSYTQKQTQQSEEGAGINGPRPTSPVVIAPTSNPVHQPVSHTAQNVDNGGAAQAVKRKSRFEVKDVPISNLANKANSTPDQLAGQSSQESSALNVNASAVPNSQQSTASLGKAKSRFEVKDIEQGTKQPSGAAHPAIVSIPPTSSPNGVNEIAGLLPSITPTSVPAVEKTATSPTIGKLSSMMSDLQKVIQDLVAENETLRRENMALKFKLTSSTGSHVVGIDAESSGSTSRSGSGSGMQSTNNPSQELKERGEPTNRESQEQGSRRVDSGGRGTYKNTHGIGYGMPGNISHGANVGSLGGVGHAQTVPRAQVQAQAQRQAVSQSVHASGSAKTGTFSQDPSQNNSVLHGTNANNGTAVFPGQMHHRPTHVSSPSKVSSGIATGSAGGIVVEMDQNNQRALSATNGHISFPGGYEAINGNDSRFTNPEVVTDSGSGTAGRGGNGNTGRLDGASNWND